MPPITPPTMAPTGVDFEAGAGTGVGVDGDVVMVAGVRGVVEEDVVEVVLLDNVLDDVLLTAAELPFTVDNALAVPPIELNNTERVLGPAVAPDVVVTHVLM